MGMNDTPVSERFTIGIFGRRNAGKSSIINAITNQQTALTSSVAGTTTDPVSKTMEMLPIGPIVLIDTAGLDDVGDLGLKRVEKSYEVLRKCNLVLFVCDAGLGDEMFGDLEADFMKQLQLRKIRCIIVMNKCGNLPEIEQCAEATDIRTLAEELKRTDDLESLKADIKRATEIRSLAETLRRKTGAPVVCTDADERIGIEELKQEIIKNADMAGETISLTEGLVHPGKIAVLVTPIDSAAPKGRLILPQQQVIRDIIDKGAIPVVTRETELEKALDALAEPPEIVITDSQAFGYVGEIVDEDIPLTSFSLIFAHYKGDLRNMLNGVEKLKSLKPGDRVLIAEGCTHHRQEDDIGTVKVPRLIRKICPKVEIEHFSGASFPKDLSGYALIVHCGACMLNRREVQYRISIATDSGTAITNYGMVLAYCNGILPRAVAPFGFDFKND